MAFVRILLMNLLFRGPLRVFFGVPAGAVFGFLFCAAGGIVPAALMAPGAGALWLWRREDPNRNDRKKEGAAEMPLLLRYGGTFRWGETALRAEPVPCTDCQKRLFPFCTGIGRKSALIWQENMI